ncbi:hypothetical protein GWK47_025856 [Chionoecetes opilio]|uniref:Uncharacterized protein n=1 Tax=Chionoecetes opilio TaxID=41210 RepID=A0A8J8WLE9_CHIOP|nr:hypothetical protein GWK47_025856 [Chionoecetes opilio]
MSGGFPVPPRPDRPPHPPPPREAERYRRVPARGSSPNSLLATPPPETASKHRVEASGKRGGTYVADHLFTPGTSSAGKKGADTAAGTEADILHLAHAGPPGDAAFPRSTLWRQATSHQREGGRFQPTPNPGAHQAQAYSLISARLKHPREWSLAMQWRVGALPPPVWFTLGVGTATPPPPPATRAQNNPPQSVFLTLRKAFEWPVLTLFSPPSEEGDPGEDCSPARGLPPAPWGPGKVQGLKSRTRNGRRGRPGRHPGPFSCSTCDGRASRPALPLAPRSATPTPFGPSLSPGGVTGFAKTQRARPITPKGGDWA